MTARVTMKHARAAGLCAAGGRALAERHGLDWGKFLREGIDADELERVGGPLTARAVALAREEEGERGRQ